MDVVAFADAWDPRHLAGRAELPRISLVAPTCANNTNTATLLYRQLKRCRR